MLPSEPTPGRPLPTRLRAGLMASAAMHLGISTALVGATAGGWLAFESPHASTPMSAVFADPQSAEVDVDLRPEIEPVQHVDQVTAEMVHVRLDEVVTSAEARADEANLNELDRLGQKLESISSSAAVDEMARKLHELRGTQSRAIEPVAEPPDGPFDLATAQLYDVRRAETEDEVFPYVAILLDSAGRTMDVKMTAAEGEVAFQTFQRLKKFPLAERIYRQFTMSLLDSLVRAAQVQSAAP